MDEYLLDKLTEYAASDAYPLHMPGHKRRVSSFEHPFSIDITEIAGFDNLHHPEGILLEAQRRAARLYGADETYYLINGSTGGILAAVSAAVRRGGRILMARSSHKAAYHAALLNDLRVSWIYPEWDTRRGIYGSIRPEQVRSALAGDDTLRSRTANSIGWREGDPGQIQAVFITSPTYDGVVSDICTIAEEVHRMGAVLIVDEAHGAHFAMHPYFPESALACGADIVINSLHKTMPSLTQTALLHVRGDRVDRERLKKYLAIYQTSSPSYILMTGIDECVRMMETRKQELFDDFVQRLEILRERLGRMSVLHLVTGAEPELTAFDYDRSKILVSTESCEAAFTGPMLAALLREQYHLEAEMEAEKYITAIMTAADTQEGFDRLERALTEIDVQLRTRSIGNTVPGDGASAASDRTGRVILPHPMEKMTMGAAEAQVQEAVPIKDSPGRIAAEFVYLYPPGMPFLIPGEQIPEELPGLLEQWRHLGLKIQGMADYSAQTIRCITNAL
ncbi:MAG: decarboxylase [Lachnospiraceae bacterium]|nr:decarboxylase [Lachnospiraceae bacterium]